MFTGSFPSSSSSSSSSYFKCLPIGAPSPTSAPAAASAPCPISDCRINIKTRPPRHIYKKTDYIEEYAWESVGSLANASQDCEMKILQLVVRPNVYSREKYDYTVRTASGIVVDIFKKVDWLNNGDEISVSSFGTYTVTLLDEYT